MKSKYYCCFCSFGKDSLATLLKLIALNYPLHEVIFFNTGVEFDCIYQIRDRIVLLLKEKGILFTELYPKEPFFYSMLEKPVRKLDGTYQQGYHWCGGRCRWGTTAKLVAFDTHLANLRNNYDVYEYVGIAYDEQDRQKQDPNKLYPLINDWHMREADCLQYCYDNGIEWLEEGVRLYDILDRVSCWCCSNSNNKELYNIYCYLPNYWVRLRRLQEQIPRPFKSCSGMTIHDYERIFQRRRCIEMINSELSIEQPMLDF